MVDKASVFVSNATICDRAKSALALCGEGFDAVDIAKIFNLMARY